MDHIPDHRVAWVQLITEDAGISLETWTEAELIQARAYIGRELSERELQRREQEEEQPESTA